MGSKWDVRNLSIFRTGGEESKLWVLPRRGSCCNEWEKMFPGKKRKGHRERETSVYVGRERFPRHCTEFDTPHTPSSIES